MIEPGRTTAARRAPRLVPIAQSGQRRFDGLGRFDAGLDMQIRDQFGIRGFEWVVRRVVEADAVFLTVLPAVGAGGIEDGGELLKCFRQHGRLFSRRTKQQANGSVHLLSPLLSLNVATDSFFGDMPDGTDVVAPRPESGQSGAQVRELFPQDVRCVPLQTGGNPCRCPRWVSFHEQVHVVRHDFQRLNRQAIGQRVSLVAPE